jgi:hypothetical protein
LTTNGRSADTLAEAIGTLILSTNTARENWQNFLRERTARLVDEVVLFYITRNGLARLSPVEKRRVAACVMYAVERSRIHGHPPKQAVPLDVRTSLKVAVDLLQIPLPVVWGLLDLNVEYWEISGREMRKFDRDNENSLLLSPALAMVLFSLLGGMASVVSSWEGQEQVTALFAFRQLVLQAVRKYFKRRSDIATLDNELAALQIVKTKTVPAPSTKHTFLIPYFKDGTVWINGRAAAYADVVAPFTLYQCNFTISDVIEVILFKELAKCGLLLSEFLKKRSEAVRNPAHFGYIITCGLYGTWITSKTDSITSASNTPSSDSNEIRQRQESPAYPETLFSGPVDLGDEYYQSIDESVLSKSTTEWSKENISFVLSFNKSPALLNLDFWDTVSERKWPFRTKKEPPCPANIRLTREQLDVDGNFTPDPSQVKSWEYVLAALRPGVVIKFLWTG